MSSNGGHGATWRVPLTDVQVGTEEIDGVAEVLRSRWLSAGPRTQAFEEAFATGLGMPDAVAVSSGTAALHLTALALDLGPGDEVIVPSLSFVASAAVAALVGATPIFADVRSPGDLTIDPHHVARLLTKRTRAVVAMHYAGFAADVWTLRALLRDRGVALIEDAAHAPMVTVNGAMLGTVGDVGCFSFYASKNMTTGEGGMVVGRDAALVERIRSLRSHCVTLSSAERDRTGRSGYDVTGLGLNYRPTEMSSAIGVVQLGRLRRDRQRRTLLAAAYREALESIDGLGVPFVDRAEDSAHHLMAVVLPEGVDRSRFQAALRHSGIQTSVHYPPTHRFSYYERRFPIASPLPVTHGLAERLVSLPLHSRMSSDDVAFVGEAAADAIEALRR